MKWNETSHAKAVAHADESIFDKKIADATAASPEPVRWLTTSEAAQYLRVSISSLKTMTFRGQVRVYKLGRRNRFLREELERLFVLSTTAN